MAAVLEVADVFRRHGEAFRQARAGHLGRVERRVMGAITACRTAALGGHVEQCDDCGATRIAYNSCLMGTICNGELAAAAMPAFLIDGRFLGIVCRSALHNHCVFPPSATGHQRPVTKRDRDAGDLFFGAKDACAPAKRAKRIVH
jgi:hypothetical protein